MTDHTTPRGGTESETGTTAGAASRDVRTAPADPAGVAATDVYELEDRVVLFDVDNPLAWVEADDAVALGRMV